MYRLETRARRRLRRAAAGHAAASAQAQAVAPARAASQARRARRRACSASPPPAWTRSTRASPPPTACSSTRWRISAARAPTPGSSGCATSRSATARATTPRRRTRAPGPARSPSAIPPTSSPPVYEGLVHWADVVLIATPIRWGSASSLYFKMTERLNCIQNQLTIHNRRLITNKVAGAHHHRRPGQHPGRGRRHAHLLVGARLRVPRISLHRALPRLGRGGHAEQRAPGARERAAARGRGRAGRPGARHLARARPPSRGAGGADGARGPQGQSACRRHEEVAP